MSGTPQPQSAVPAARLDEFDKTEWRDVVRAVLPEMSDEEYEAAWNEFAAEKQARQRAKELQ